jgi:hypothetical protein
LSHPFCSATGKPKVVMSRKRTIEKIHESVAASTSTGEVGQD